MAKALQQGRLSLLEPEAKRICSLHHIPTPKSLIIKTREEVKGGAEEIGFPAVLKIVSPQIIHKTDVGGVVLNIRDEKELVAAYDQLLVEIKRRVPSAEIVGVMLERMMPPSIEIIMGGIRDHQFGPAVMLGMGGIFAEVYNDVTFRVAPIDRNDALRMMGELKGSKVLRGARGSPPADAESIAGALTQVSDLMMAHESIDQLDLNPVLAYPDGICAVDTRIILRQPGGGP